VSTLRFVETKWRAVAADPRVIDAVLVAGCLVLTVLAVKGHWSVLPRPVIAAAGVAGSAAQWFRRRHPHVAALAGAAAYALSGNPGPPLVGLYAGGSYAGRRQAWIVAVAGWAGIAGWSWLDAGRLTASNAVTSALVAVAVVATGGYAATRRALRDSLVERAEQAEAEQALRDERARFAERTRIAREMHDVLAHKVTLIALHAGALELKAGEDPEQARQGAALIRVTAREALRELRTVLGVLQAGPGPEMAPFADLTALVEASAQAGQEVELHDQAGPLPPEVARVVYRVAQEGLTNARKHAPGAPATISIDRGAEAMVTVTVHNAPATGAPLDLPGAGSGLIGLAERLRLVGGSLRSGRDAADGWELRASIPCTEGTGAA